MFTKFKTFGRIYQDYLFLKSCSNLEIWLDRNKKSPTAFIGLFITLFSKRFFIATTSFFLPSQNHQLLTYRRKCRCSLAHRCHCVRSSICKMCRRFVLRR